MKNNIFCRGNGVHRETNKESCLIIGSRSIGREIWDFLTHTLYFADGILEVMLTEIASKVDVGIFSFLTMTRREKPVIMEVRLQR